MMIPDISPIMTCRICGQSKESDEGGIPADCRHPYFGQWICDSCMEQLDFTPNNCTMCEYYAAVNQDAGICTYHYRTGLEKADAAAGHDDFVNAKDCCPHFRDSEIKCCHCQHYQRKTHVSGYCDIIQVHKKLLVQRDDVCDNFRHAFEDVR